MFTSHQKLLLKIAAKSDEKTRIKEIDKVIETFKLTDSYLFHNYVDGVPGPSMKMRKFFDEPYSLKPEEFFSYEVRYVQNKQKEMFNRRSKLLLKI